jgi:hypothetical protein
MSTKSDEDIFKSNSDDPDWSTLRKEADESESEFANEITTSKVDKSENTTTNTPTGGSNQDDSQELEVVIASIAKSKPKSVPGYQPQKSHREEFNTKSSHLGRYLKLDKQVFDYISDAHSKRTAHAGQDNTYGILKEKCSSISQDLVLLFIKTCPAC